MRGALPLPVSFKSASAVIIRLRETQFVAREAGSDCQLATNFSETPLMQ
jgi:hypothetical protein